MPPVAAKKGNTRATKRRFWAGWKGDNGVGVYVKDATSNKCIATRNKCLTSSNKKLLRETPLQPHALEFQTIQARDFSGKSCKTEGRPRKSPSLSTFPNDQIAVIVEKLHSNRARI